VLTESLREYLPAKVLVVLPDHQMTLSWGWQTPQDEISGLCQIMIDDRRGDLPEGWDICLWTELAARSKVGFSGQYQKAIAAPRTEQLARIYEKRAKTRSQRLQSSPRGYSLKKAAQYAAEGAVLAEVLPNSILVQSEEIEAGLKGQMYQILGPTLPIIEPFR